MPTASGALTADGTALLRFVDDDPDRNRKGLADARRGLEHRG